MLRKLSLLAGLVMLAAGCGGKESYKLVPVSGKVMMNGKPLSRAHVNFQPASGSLDKNLGPGSYAATDAEGKFVLYVEPGKPGAVVGRHLVRIATILKGEDQYKPSDTGSPDGYTGPPVKEMIPDRYNESSTLYFTVPDEGTDKAVFALTSP